MSELKQPNNKPLQTARVQVQTTETVCKIFLVSIKCVYLGDKAQSESTSTCSCSTTYTMNVISRKPGDEYLKSISSNSSKVNEENSKIDKEK